MAILNESNHEGGVGSETRLDNGQAKLAVENELIARHLAASGHVNVTGCGKFMVTERAARQGRKPQTGETIRTVASSRQNDHAAGHRKRRPNPPLFVPMFPTGLVVLLERR